MQYKTSKIRIKSYFRSSTLHEVELAAQHCSIRSILPQKIGNIWTFSSQMLRNNEPLDNWKEHVEIFSFPLSSNSKQGL